MNSSLTRRSTAAVAALVLAASLAGCATLGNPFATYARIAYEGDVRPLDEAAVVIGDGVIRFMKVNRRPLEQYRRVGPEVLAGGFPLIEVLPGPNTFELCFSYATPAGSAGPTGGYATAYSYGAGPNYGGGPTYNTGFCRDTVTVTLDAERGRTYQAQFRQLRGNSWTAQFVDVTSSQGADVAQRRRELARHEPRR